MSSIGSKKILASIASNSSSSNRSMTTIITSFSGFAMPFHPKGEKKKAPPTPRIVPYDVVTTLIQPSLAVNDAIEHSFSELAKNNVICPFPMHINIAEEGWVGPGDAHVKAGYIKGADTFSVKVASVGFTQNLVNDMSPASGLFIVNDAASGHPKAIICENRYLTDLRTGAAGAIALKHLKPFASNLSVAFLGTGAVARQMALATQFVTNFDRAYAYDPQEDRCEKFCEDMNKSLSCEFNKCATPQQALRDADVIFTQTPGAQTVLQLEWIKPHALIVATGADQASKQEIPVDVMCAAKVITDLTKQCEKNGELRSAIAARRMSTKDVHAELGEVINGTKKGREGGELIVVDLTGTGAQDTAIGDIAYKILSTLD
jgi:ornithine cyclodeaminase/alanine dehydrogenase-like protein (mu-crystallin family)